MFISLLQTEALRHVDEYHPMRVVFPAKVTKGFAELLRALNHYDPQQAGVKSGTRGRWSLGSSACSGPKDGGPNRAGHSALRTTWTPSGLQQQWRRARVRRCRFATVLKHVLQTGFFVGSHKKYKEVSKKIDPNNLQFFWSINFMM